MRPIDIVDKAMMALGAVFVAFLAVLALGGIIVVFQESTDWKVGEPFAIENTISEISFSPEHKESVSHGKTSSTETIPDKWFILFCRIKDGAASGECFWKPIRHAPWSWQKAGQRVTIFWQDWHYSNWTLVRFVVDGAEVTL